jgi:hypothetical protein
MISRRRAAAGAKCEADAVAHETQEAFAGRRRHVWHRLFHRGFLITKTAGAKSKSAIYLGLL